ncbi:hypothetical protein CXF68_19940 [Tenacibaculum sp. Bg11-29]|uniref:DUF5457 domain-containing protein n=1 Tax=Tenacibaculum sp. Bg11-29 TaxID=2058306 RepID=UPI000C339B81|nr:DUF5457 domain-containing protein [Tenacibaculum sp. Bg11-29]PKH52827.1 hypothetical protein CXF68_19940 [Tenacibaculum sp. Bg11-29]
MSTPTVLPIHEVILKIMYNADREKPIGLTSSDILWKIDNPEITERYVREVLGWLVRERKVKLYLEKYSLDRHEFLTQKTKNVEEEEEVEVLSAEKETFYIKPSKKKIKNIRSKIFFFTGTLVLCFVTYLYVNMLRDYEVTTKEITASSIEKKQTTIRNLYLSNEDDENENVNKKIENIAYLFSKQNKNNKNIKKEIARLYKVTDSLQKQQQSKVNIIQKKLDVNLNKSINYTNGILKKIILCNILFLVIIVFTFFKGKI